MTTPWTPQLPPLPVRRRRATEYFACGVCPLVFAVAVRLVTALGLDWQLWQSLLAGIAVAGMVLGVALRGYPTYFRQEELGWSLPLGDHLLFLQDFLVFVGIAVLGLAALFAGAWYLVGSLGALAIAALFAGLLVRYCHLVFRRHHVRRGRRLLTQAEHRERALAKIPAGDPGILFGPFLLPSRDAEHVLLLGKTSTGKSKIMQLLEQSSLPQVGRGKDVRAMVFSPKGDALGYLVGMGVKPQFIKYLHPFDERPWSVAWDIGRDCQDPEVARQIGTVLIPEEEGQNRYFSDSAREILIALLIALGLRCGKNFDFRDVLLAAKSKETLRAVLEAFPEVSEVYDVIRLLEDPKTTPAILSTILSRINAYGPIAAAWSHAKEKVSLQDWVKGEFILVMAHDDSIKAQLNAINRVMFELAAQLALAQQDSDKRRTWFYLDETRELEHLETLRNLLTFGRSRGICVVLALQDIEGFRDAFGDKKGNEISSQPSNIAIFKLQSPETAKWAADVIGEQEIYDDSSGGQGSGQVVTRAAVMPDDLKELAKPSRDTGLGGYYVTSYGVSRGFIPGDWLEKALLPPHPDVPAFVKRPREQKFLRRWDQAERERLGLTLPEGTPKPAEKPPERPPRFRFTKGGTVLGLQPNAEEDDEDGLTGAAVRR